MNLPRMLEAMDVSKLADGNHRRHELKAFEGHQGFNRGREFPFSPWVSARITKLRCLIATSKARVQMMSQRIPRISSRSLIP